MEPIAIVVNDLGEPDAGNPPVRFDEGRRLCAFYSTTGAELMRCLRWVLILLIAGSIDSEAVVVLCNFCYRGIPFSERHVGAHEIKPIRCS